MPTGWSACDDTSERTELLEQENAQLRYAIKSRPVIDLARGALMASFGCTASDAWEILVEVSQNSNIKLRAVAEQVTAAVSGQESLPPALQSHLQTALERRRPGWSSPPAQRRPSAPPADRASTVARSQVNDPRRIAMPARLLTGPSGSHHGLMTGSRRETCANQSVKR
ncbi:ANTAR domain-containing protein [Streptomyces sp. NPDC005393]|uniref:ANTAR domain-containing protein n=1 Tax=Streptomyces sp. NPDC005393 TaxID=3157041 RepID=UPI0033B287EF